jgi:organic radical activating enzyme
VSTSRANIFEVFSGIQGEGLHVGRRHLFVRFAGCNLACRYCDTPAAREPVPVARIERAAGSRTYDEVPNPLAAEDLARRIAGLDESGWHDAISLTGGEPLLAADFIVALAPLCGDRRLYLETNGSLPDELEKVIDVIDTIAMDIKLPSVAGRVVDLAVSRAFLERATRRDVFVKVVVGAATGPDALADAALIAASVDKAIPLVIQPVTPGAGGVKPPCSGRLLELQQAARGILEDVRVIPQMHARMGEK